MNTKEVINFYSKNSTQFTEKIASLEIYNSSYSDFILLAPRKQSILDLACGPGNVSSYIQKIIPHIQITCVDLSPEMIEIAKTKIPNAKFYISDILNITIPSTKYDVIICAFGLPYVERNKINIFVSEINRYSNKGSFVYISCMEGSTIEQETMSFANNQKVLVQRFTKNEIIEAFLEYNFNLAHYRAQNYTEPDGSITTDMIFFFEKM